MRKGKNRKERFFIRRFAETKTEAEWLYFESFGDKDGYKTLFFFAKEPFERRRFCICEAKTGMRIFSNICKLDEMTFWKITSSYVEQKQVRGAVLRVKRVSRLPDYKKEEWEDED